jgi:hypothetical protein
MLVPSAPFPSLLLRIPFQASLLPLTVDKSFAIHDFVERIKC